MLCITRAMILLNFSAKLGSFNRKLNALHSLGLGDRDIHQYFEYQPLVAMAASSLRGIDSIRFSSSSSDDSSQTSIAASQSLCNGELFFGATDSSGHSLQIPSCNDFHRFSIGFKSGEYGDQSTISRPLPIAQERSQSCTRRAECVEELS